MARRKKLELNKLFSKQETRMDVRAREAGQRRSSSRYFSLTLRASQRKT
jgi:hypothetical protein